MSDSPLSMRFSRQGYWSGLPFLPPGHTRISAIFQILCLIGYCRILSKVPCVTQQVLADYLQNLNIYVTI